MKPTVGQAFAATFGKISQADKASYEEKAKLAKAPVSCRKIMGKSWENHGKMMFLSDFFHWN